MRKSLRIFFIAGVLPFLAGCFHDPAGGRSLQQDLMGYQEVSASEVQVSASITYNTSAGSPKTDTMAYNDQNYVYGFDVAVPDDQSTITYNFPTVGLASLKDTKVCMMAYDKYKRRIFSKDQCSSFGGSNKGMDISGVSYQGTTLSVYIRYQYDGHDSYTALPPLCVKLQ